MSVINHIASMPAMNLIASISALVSAICSIVLTKQVYLLKAQMKEDHDRSRRENTVTALITWSKSIRRETSVAETIVEKFSDEQCRDLFGRKEIIINQELKQLVDEISPGSKLAKRGKNYVLAGEALNCVRWHVISYLNILESILAAWKLGTVERDMIEIQFAPLYNDGQGWNLLERMRKATGNSYPVIDEFAQTMRRKHEEAAKQNAYRPTGLGHL